MDYMIVQFCEGCMDYVLGVEEPTIEFTVPVCICEVDMEDCDNLERNGKIEYNERVTARGTVQLDD